MWSSDFQIISEIWYHSSYNRSMVQQNDDNPQISEDGRNVQGEKCDTSSVLTEVDHSEDSIQETKEEKIKQLMLSISEVLEKNQFSSAGELTKFLEVVEVHFIFKNYMLKILSIHKKFISW